MRLILMTIGEGVAAEGSVSSPPGLLSSSRLCYGSRIEKGIYYEIGEL